MRPLNWPEELPWIDPDIENVGVTWVRGMNSCALRDMQKLVVIHDGPLPLCVVIPYRMYIKLQQELVKKRGKRD